MRARLLVLLALGGLTGAACGSCGKGGGANPPAAPLPRHPSPEAFAGYPHDDAGRPILMTSNFDGFGLEIAFDETIDDPISHWGQCVDRVTACMATNQGRLGNCVDLIEICDAGTNDGCCPQGCIDAYKVERKSQEEMPAIRASFLEGSCIEGLKDQLSILDEPDVVP